MDNFSETVRKRNKALLYIIITLFIFGIATVILLDQLAIEPSQFENDPAAIATDTAQLLESYPELANWARLTDRDVSIWMPESYENESIDEAIELAKQGNERLPERLQGTSDMLVNSPDRLRFVADDTSTDGLFTDNVMIIREPAGLLSLNQYFDNTIQNLSNNINVIQQNENVQLEYYAATSVVYSVEIMPNLEIASVLYTIQTNGYFYSINFSTTADNIDAFLTVVERAINTLRVY